jgi:hypothetical protein
MPEAITIATVAAALVALIAYITHSMKGLDE